MRLAIAAAASSDEANSCRIRSGLERGLATIFVADSDGFGDIVNKNLTVSYIAGPCCGSECFDNLFGASIRNHQLHFHLWPQVYVVFLPAIDFLVALLASVTTHFRDGHAVDADALQGFLHLFQLKRLDDRFDLLHVFLSPLGFEIVAFFTMHTYVKTCELLFAVDTDTYQHVTNLECDERAGYGEDGRNCATTELIDNLHRVAIDQPERRGLSCTG